MNHTRFPKENHLPYWAHRANKDNKGDRVDDDVSGDIQEDEIPGGALSLNLLIYLINHIVPIITTN